MRKTITNQLIEQCRKKIIGVQLKVKNSLVELKEDERGMGMVEIALIIIIIVALGITFKSEITKLLESIFSELDYSSLKG